LANEWFETMTMTRDVQRSKRQALHLTGRDEQWTFGMYLLELVLAKKVMTVHATQGQRLAKELDLKYLKAINIHN
jgi:hypothetical protein